MSKTSKKTAKSARRPKLSGLSRRVVGLPDRMRLTMPYGSEGLISPAAGSYAVQSFRGNSVYDPDFSGTGTTAFLYTQMTALYYKYRVLGIRAEVNFLDSATAPLTVGVLVSNQNTVPSMPYLIGARHCWRMILAPGGPQTCKHTISATTGAVYGVTEKVVRSEDDFTAVAGTNPNNTWWLHLFIDNTISAAPGYAAYSLRVEYDVEWSIPLNLAP